MKFIFNFIFFGLLFFIIWHYFPDAFATMVSWASKTFEFLKDLVVQLIEKIKPGTVTHDASKSLLGFGLAYWFVKH